MVTAAQVLQYITTSIIDNMRGDVRALHVRTALLMLLEKVSPDDGVRTVAEDYTIQATDDGATLLFASPGEVRCIVTADPEIPIGASVELGQTGAGLLRVEGSGAIVDAPQGLRFARRYLFARLKKTAQNRWSLVYFGLPAIADLPVHDNGEVTGGFRLDRDKGEAQHITLAGNATLQGVDNFRAGQSKLVLTVKSTGNWALGWPGVMWPGGAAPEVTQGAGARDKFILLSDDGGASVEGTIVAQDYRLPD